MFSRTLRVVVGLAVVSGAYWVYSVAIVPVIVAEQRTDRREPAPAPSPLPGPVLRLQPYFHPGDWELKDAIVVDNPQFSLVVGDYETLPAGGQIKIAPCTLMFFPDGRPPEGLAPRFIILQAPDGAVLDFDEQCDLSRGKIGRLVGGRLVGEVTIRGNIGRDDTPRQLAHSDLLIRTRDVELSAERIWTKSEVQFRLGGNHGHGHEMQMTFADLLKAKDSQRPALDALDVFQLARDVRLHAELGSSSLLPGSGRQSGPPQKDNAALAEAPIEIRCRGRFQFRFRQMAATFEDQVDVLRVNVDGPADQMNAELLTLQFSFAPAGAVATAGAAQKRTLRASSIDARGSPVVVRSPAVGGFARCQHFVFDIEQRRLTMDDAQKVQLRYGANEFEARQLKYVAGASALGEVWALGPGRMRAELPESDTPPTDEPGGLNVSWQGELQVRPHEGKQLISVTSGARIQYAAIGTLAGDEVWLWLTENSRGGTPPVDPRRAARFRRFAPQAMLAQGDVKLDSKQVSGKTERLEVWFRPKATATESGGGSGSPAASLASERGSDSGSHYDLHAGQIRIQLGMPDQGSPVVQNVTLTGDVHVSERPSSDRTAKPLILNGQHVELRAADTPQASVTLAGAPAYVAGRGAAISGPSIQLERATGRMWVAGGGNMTLPVDRDLNGEPLDQPQSLDVLWQKQMSFDGQNIVFDGGVEARTALQQMRTGNLVVTLNKKINFDRPIAKNEIKLARIACRGGVFLQSMTVEQNRQTSLERIQVRDLSIDQNSGKILATGPGWVSSVRESSGGLQLSTTVRTTGASATTRGTDTGDGKLAAIKVQFQRAITGNLHDKQLQFDDQVRCIYGPVTRWDEMIDPDEVGGPTGSEVLLTCDRLGISQVGTDPKGGRPIDLEAFGRARVDGETFTAKGHRLTYATAKGLLVLEGTGQTDAEIWRQARVGAKPTYASAQKLLYWRSTGRVEIQGARIGSGTFGASN